MSKILSLFDTVTVMCWWLYLLSAGLCGQL